MNENDAKEVAARFGGSAATYDMVATVQSHLAERLAEAAAPFIAPECDILDVGCGTGCLVKRIAASVKPFRVSLMDISGEMLKLAARNVAALCDILVDCYIGDAETMPWPASNAVVSSSAIQWFENPLTFVSKAREVLTEGGVVALATYGPSTFAELRGGRPCGYPSLDDWLRALTEAGFEILCSDRSVEEQSFASRTEMLRMMALSGIGTNRDGQSTEAMNGTWRLTWEPLLIVAKLPNP